MNRPDAETIALLKIALRNLVATSHPSAERTYAVAVLKEVDAPAVECSTSPTGKHRFHGPVHHQQCFFCQLSARS